MGKIPHLIYVQPLYKIIVMMVLLVLIWGFLNRWKGAGWWKLLNTAVFLSGFAAVIYVTLGTREPGVHEVILTPFQSFIDAKEQPELYRSMLMNVFLFVPIGVSLPNILPGKWHPAWNVVLTILFGFCLSAAVEWYQFRFGLGRCEVDDVITNTFGTLIGTLSYAIAPMIEKKTRQWFS